MDQPCPMMSKFIWFVWRTRNNLVKFKVVWRETKQLGLGIAQQGQKYIVVGRYRPAGNMTNAGYFERNVAPLKGSESSLPDLGSEFYFRSVRNLPVDLI